MTSTVKVTKYTTSIVRRCTLIHITLTMSQWKTVVIMLRKLHVRSLFFPCFRLHVTKPCHYLDHRPRIIRSEKSNEILHSPSLDIGMWVPPFHIKHSLPPLGSQTSTNPSQNGRTSFSVECVMLFSATLLVVSCLVAFIMDLPRFCERM